MKKKFNEWFRRYFIAEISGVVVALVFSQIFILSIKNIIITAFLVTWIENLAYYGIIAYKDLKIKREKNGLRLGASDYMKQFRNMIIEFGPAEYLDSFLIRPFCLSFFPYIISNYALAIFVGLMIANIIYYIPTIISYEARKKIFKE